MQVTMQLALGLALGVVAGGSYFGGLAWTLRRLPTAGSPGVLVVASLLVRLAALAGLVFVATTGGLVTIAALLLALLAVRTVLVRRAAAVEGSAG